MRIRSVVIVALLLPAALSAQRRSVGARIGGRVAPPAELPPQPGFISREMRYVRLPISAESYAFISYMQAPTGPASQLTNWGTLGAATRLDYRLGALFSATADITQTVFGGPVMQTSLELGTRFHPVGAAIDSRMTPFVDARVGYLYSTESYLNTPDPTSVNPGFLVRNRQGDGVGLIGGVGSAYSLTRSLSMTTGLWAARSRVHAANATAGFAPTSYQTYYSTSYRLALGLRWNPVRAVPMDDER